MARHNMGPYTLEESVAPSAEPITTAEAKSYIFVDSTVDDTLLDDLIKSARLEIGDNLGLSFVNTTWKMYLDAFPPTGGEVIFPRNPVSSVSSVTYLDENGDSQTWSSSLYQTDLKSRPARLKPIESEDWPSTQSLTYNTVTITFVAGFGAAAANVPEDYQLLTRRVIRALYDDERNSDSNRTAFTRVMGALMNKRWRWVV